MFAAAPHKYADLRTYFHVLSKEQGRSGKSATNVIDHEKISVDEDQSDEDTPIFQKTEVWEEPDKSDEDYEEYQEAMTRRIAALTALFDNGPPFERR